MRFVLILLFTISLNAQDLSNLTLSNIGEEDLLTLFNEVEDDSIKAEKVARVYLNRARKEKDTIKMARGYDRLARIFHSKKNIQFADSIIYLTKDIKNITYPGLGYILKATEYYSEGNLKLTFENLIEAYELAIKNDNVAHQVYISDNLIYLKIFWGNKKEALALQKKRHKLITHIDFYKELKKSIRKDGKININDLYIENELFSFSNFILCYTELKELDSAQHYLNLSYKSLKKYKGTPEFKKSYALRLPLIGAEINYYKKEYATSLDTINFVLSKVNANFNNSILIKNLYLYKGLNLYELNKKEEGVKFLIKADSIIETNSKRFVPYHRMIYEKLIEFYTDKDDLNNKLKYLEKSIIIDSIIKDNYQFFEPTLIKEFENPKLFKEKEIQIDELKFKNLASKSIIWISLGILSTCLLVIYVYHKKQKAYKIRFTELMVQKKNIDQSKAIKLSTDVYNNILNQLELFELQRKFLKNDININKLAKSFGTNQKYLSKVINIEKEKNFSQYLNDLRITFAFEELQINEKLRNYTIKAIAKESGFKNAESFSKAFYKKYKIQPSFYLKQLRKRSVT